MTPEHAPRRWAALRTPTAIGAILILGTIAVLALIGPGPWKAAATTINIPAAGQGPSAAHWFGTDQLGRDIMARVLSAVRVSVLLALAATALGAVVGIVAGALTGVLTGRPQRFGNRVIAVALAFPAVLTALIVSAILGAGKLSAVMAIGIAMVPGFARISQTLSASVAGSDYFVAGRLLGVRRTRLLGRYLLPNIAEPLIVAVASSLGEAVLAISALSYLGLGVQLPDYDWGSMLGEGLKKIYTAPAAALAPGIAVVVVSLGCILAGEALASGMDPGQRRRLLFRVKGFGAVAEAADRPPVPAPVPDAVLEVRDLTVRIAATDLTPVRGIDLTVRSGEMLGLVGESGSGKTLTGLSVAQLLPAGTWSTARRLQFIGKPLSQWLTRDRRRQFGTALAVMFQDPQASLNPTRRVGPQLTEKLRINLRMSRREAKAAAIAALVEMGIDEPKRRMRQYPHELSGGMRQRVMLAMAVLGEPALLVADEPTTALDVTVQAQVIELMRRVNRRHGTAVILVSHDISVVRALCDRLVVMYAGRIVEDGPTELMLSRPRHPYTSALLAAIPTLDVDRRVPLPTIPGSVPSPGSRPDGCAFRSRCPRAAARCADEVPPLTDDPAGRVACWHPLVPA